MNMSDSKIATFILFQRHSLQKLQHTLFFRLLRHYKTRIRLESLLRHEAIIAAYKEQIQGEWERLLPFLPDNVHTMIDIGCGVGGIAAWYHHHYQHNDDLNIILADGNQLPGSIQYGFNAVDVPYNSLEVTRTFLHNAGVPGDVLELVDIQTEPLPDHTYDLVISLLSWGFHYPLDVYLDYVAAHLAPAGVIIVDIRQSENIEETLARYQLKAETLEEDAKRRRVRIIRT